MEAKDLIVGDWIYNIHNQKPEQVCEFMESTVMLAYNDLYCYDEIEPIPLTLEILEKNGFYYGYTSNEEDLASSTISQLSEDDKGWCWDEGDGAIKVIFPNESDGGMVIVDDQSFGRHLEMVFCETIFVHELQHALRLCGIGKEIVL